MSGNASGTTTREPKNGEGKTAGVEALERKESATSGDKKETTVVLKAKVLESYARDVGRMVARIDYDTMDVFDATTGDLLEIKGSKTTLVKALPLYPSDEGKGMIRIDEPTRCNAGADVGQSVTILRQVKAETASKVILLQLEATPPLDERYIADVLDSRGITKGDKLVLPFFGGKISFEVKAIFPAGANYVDKSKTTFQIGLGEKNVATWERDALLNDIEARVDQTILGLQEIKKEIGALRETDAWKG